MYSMYFRSETEHAEPENVLAALMRALEEGRAITERDGELFIAPSPRPYQRDQDERWRRARCDWLSAGP